VPLMFRAASLLLLYALTLGFLSRDGTYGPSALCPPKGMSK